MTGPPARNTIKDMDECRDSNRTVFVFSRRFSDSALKLTENTQIMRQVLLYSTEVNKCRIIIILI